MDDIALRVTELELRVAELERRLAAGAQAPLVAELSPAGGQGRLIEVDSPLGLTWLNRVGAVIVIAGLALAALWAHERGHLTPPIRNLLALAVATAVFVAGSRGLGSRDPARGRFAVGVVAVGAFMLYLVPFMASGIDHIAPPAVAALAAAALTALLIVLAVRRRAPIYALLATVGAAAYAGIAGRQPAMMVIGLAAAAGGLLLSIEVLCVAGALVLAVAVSLLGGLAAAPVGLAIVAGLLGQAGAWRRWPLTRSLSLVLASGAWVAVLVLDRRQTLSGGELAMFALLVLALEGCRRGVLGRERGEPLALLGWIATQAIVLGAALRAVPVGLPASLVLAGHGLALMTIGVLWRHLPTRVLALMLLGLASLKALVVDLWAQELGLRVLAFLALGAALLFASFLYSRLERRIR